MNAKRSSELLWKKLGENSRIFGTSRSNADIQTRSVAYLFPWKASFHLNCSLILKNVYLHKSYQWIPNHSFNWSKLWWYPENTKEGVTVSAFFSSSLLLLWSNAKKLKRFEKEIVREDFYWTWRSLKWRVLTKPPEKRLDKWTFLAYSREPSLNTDSKNFFFLLVASVEALSFF